MEKFQITKQGFEKLKAELNQLKNEERPKIIQAIATVKMPNIILQKISRVLLKRKSMILKIKLRVLK
jgi:transcription elongation GreA/GreB family factor